MTHETNGHARLDFDGDLIMRTSDASRATLREAIERQGDSAVLAPTGIAIDCSAAEEVDLTFIQLLIASRLSAHDMGKTLFLAACPDGALLDTLTRGGFQIVCESGPEDAAAFWFHGAPA